MDRAELLQRVGNQLRILSILATTRAGSGHPTSCCSAADLVAALFFGKMRFDPVDPHNENNDRFVLSKGHAAPLLYAAWEETGHVSRDDIMQLREVGSPFEGHPTPRLDFVDVATGSLGQGLSAGLGMAIHARLRGLDYLTYVLMGDGELAEGSIWEAASIAGARKQNNLIAIADVNRLGQSQATPFGHHVEVYQRRFEAFGWEAITIDGHDMSQILSAYSKAGLGERPLAIIAATIKGKGIPGIADKNGWHGKPLPADLCKEAVAALTPDAQSARGAVTIPSPSPLAPKTLLASASTAQPDYDRAKPVSVRRAFGNALARLGGSHPRMVVLDGDVENSTYTDEFGKLYPERLIECYIAEQNMLGVAQGLAALGQIPFVSTFAAFFTRAFDQIRMASISALNLKLVGTHCGISIGEDGPSQMGIEDIAMMRAIQGSIVLSPCDAYSTERLIERMTETRGIQYLRATRPETPILYGPEDTFELGGARVLRSSTDDRTTVVATGITVFEALKAYDSLRREGISITVIDAYSIKPLARELIRGAAEKTGGLVISVEDHAIEGGLGDAIAGELSEERIRVHKLGVRGVPHSGKKQELLSKFGIDSNAIIGAVRARMARGRLSA
jgi:transketolase